MDEIVDFECRFTEKLAGPLAVQLQQLALDCADTGLGHIAIFGRQLLGVFRRVSEHRLQIFEVQQQQALFIGKPERDIQYALLGLVQIHQSRQQ